MRVRQEGLLSVGFLVATMVKHDIDESREGKRIEVRRRQWKLILLLPIQTRAFASVLAMVEIGY